MVNLVHFDLSVASSCTGDSPVSQLDGIQPLLSMHAGQKRPSPIARYVCCFVPHVSSKHKKFACMEYAAMATRMAKIYRVQSADVATNYVEMQAQVKQMCCAESVGVMLTCVSSAPSIAQQCQLAQAQQARAARKDILSAKTRGGKGTPSKCSGDGLGRKESGTYNGQAALSIG